MLKNQNGITLVALVVTIVVLIILATISISVAINGGIINRAEKAKDLWENGDDQMNQVTQQVIDYVRPYFANAGVEFTD